jgi:hypothetical protein
LLILVVGSFLTVGAGLGPSIEPVGAKGGPPPPGLTVVITKEFRGTPPDPGRFVVRLTCDDRFTEAVFTTGGDLEQTVQIFLIDPGTSCTVTEPTNPCRPPAEVISPATFTVPTPGSPEDPVEVTVTNDCRTVVSDKAVNGWNTLAEVDRPERFYCVQMKTVATAGDELAVGKTKVRVLKSKFATCDKRVRNLNLGSTAAVALAGDAGCAATGAGAVTVPGTKLLNAKASDSVLECVDGFLVSGAASVSVGKNKDGLSPPTVVDIAQDGPSLPA